MLLCLLLPLQIMAEPLSPEMALIEARKLALAGSVEMQTAALVSRNAQLSESGVKYSLFPDLSISSSFKMSSGENSAALDSDTSTVAAGASLSQTIWDGGQFPLERKLAAAETEAAVIEEESVRLSVLSQCDTLFFAYLEALAGEESARADLAASTALLEEAEVKLENGAITRASYLEVRATAASRNAALWEAKGARLQAGNELSSFLGMDSPPEIQGELPGRYLTAAAFLARVDQSDASAMAEKLISAALHPDVLLSSIAVRQAALTADMDLRQYSPQLSLSLSGSLSSLAGADLTPGSSLSLSGSMGLTQWDRGIVKKQGVISLRTAELNARETRRQTDISIRSALYSLLSAAGTVVSAEAANDYAGELYSEMKEMYALSAVGFSDMKDSEADWIEARNSFVTAKYNFLSKLSLLTYAIGSGDETFLFDLLVLPDAEELE